MKNKILVIVLFFLRSICFSQGKDNGDPSAMIANILPSSPNSAALGKFGEMPVSTYTGIPNIDIPIYTIQSGKLTIPISLNYHAGGVKVDEIASNVGLGWALSFGGQISRTVRGLPDESQFGYLNNNVDLEALVDADQATKLIYYNKVNANTTDLEPDIFYYNFLGKSGRFLIDKATRKGYPLNNDLKIDIVWIDENQWLIKDDRGNKFYFGKFENEIARDKNIVTYNGRPSALSATFPSAWYLIRAEDIVGQVISFSYTSYTSSYCSNVFETKYWLVQKIPSIGQGCSSSSIEKMWNETEILGYKLSSISWKEGHVDFVYSQTGRSDLNTNDNNLEYINVYNHLSPNYLFKFKLTYSYFTKIGANEQLICNGSNTGRLRLDKIEHIDTKGVVMKPYEFFYFGGTPNINSYKRDHWGFYNGAQNETLIPAEYYYGGSSPMLLVGADRNPNLDATKNGTLYKIVYPTGGYNILTYELNDAYMSDFTNQQTSVNLIQYASALKSNMNMIPYDEDDFVINGIVNYNGMVGEWVTLTISINGTCNPSLRDGGGCGGDVYIQSPDGTGLSSFNLSSANNISTFSQEVFLENGNYEVVIDGYGSVTNLNILSAVVKGPDHSQMGSDGQYNKLLGGLRIAKIESFDAFDKKNITSYHYKKENEGNKSSGVIVSIPKYNYLYTKLAKVDGDAGITTCVYYVRTSSSQVQLGNTMGCVVGYGYVEKIQGDQENSQTPLLKTSFAYTNPSEYPDVQNYNFPFPPATSKDVKRGLLKVQKEFTYINGNFVPVKIITNEYELPDNRYFKSIFGVKIGCDRVNEFGICNNLPTSKYSDESIWVWKKKETVEEISVPNGNSILTTQSFFYENPIHLQLTKLMRSDSKGETISTKYKYPLDYSISGSANDDASKGILQLQNSFVHSQVIEQYTQVSNSNGQNNRTVEGTINIIDPSKPSLKSTLTLNIQSPITDFTNTSVSAGIFGFDNRYKPKIYFDNYDTYGNILQLHKSNDLNSVFIWDYFKAYPTAQVTNADQSDIAYTSFESDGTGNFNNYTGVVTTVGTPLADRSNMPPTGNKYYNLTTAAGVKLTKSGLTSSKEYIVSYWRNSTTPYTITGGTAVSNGYVVGRTVNGWTYHQHRITGAAGITIEGSGGIDEVRIYPGNAQMTTYTYEPLVGMTSQCDVSGKIIYYEYDGFQRLKAIRDQDNNIIKQFDYQYQQQP